MNTRKKSMAMMMKWGGTYWFHGYEWEYVVVGNKLAVKDSRKTTKEFSIELNGYGLDFSPSWVQKVFSYGDGRIIK